MSSLTARVDATATPQLHVAGALATGALVVGNVVVLGVGGT
jgi:hypothetical protein